MQKIVKDFWKHRISGYVEAALDVVVIIIIVIAIASFLPSENQINIENDVGYYLATRG